MQPGGLLRALTGQDCLQVNSLHHQGIRRVGEGLMVEAVAEDGLIEAVSLPGRRFALGVQWHPEYLWRADAASAALFRDLVERAVPVSHLQQ